MTDRIFEHDVMIVGGGPAGSTCARFLAREGLDVALFERTGALPVKRTSAGIFDHTWKALELDPADYPSPLLTPHAFDFVTLKDRKRLPDLLPVVAPLMKRRVYFPNRDEFDTWLLEQAKKAGAHVLPDATVHPTGLEQQSGRYALRVGNEQHVAPTLVGAAGTRCPVYRRFFEPKSGHAGETMLLTEVEAPASEYGGPSWASYFGFIKKDVFAWTYEVGEGWIHIGTAAFSAGRARKKDMLFDDFLAYLKAQSYIAPDFDPKQHHSSGGSIRMFADYPMTTRDGHCHVIGDAAGLMQRDAYNGITNAILSGRLCAHSILRKEAAPDLRRKLNPFLYQDVLRDIVSRPLSFLRRS